MTKKRTKKGPSRRQFLGGALAMGAGLTALANPFSRMGVQQALASAGQLTDRHFIFCYFSGGWDLLISLDPRDPAIFREDLKKVTLIQPGYHLLASNRRELVTTSVPDIVFGPFIGDMARHADKVSLIRGMSMDTLTHEVGRRRFLTGKQPAGLQARGSSIPTAIAAQIGNDTPIPNLSVKVEAYNEDQPDFATAIRVTSVTDLVRALKQSDTSLGNVERAALNELFSQTRNCPIDNESVTHNRGYEANVAAQDLVSRGLSPLFDFAANTPQMEAIRDHYNIDPYDLASGEAQAAMAVTALEAGISRCVSIEAASGLDAHGPTWASGHGPKMERGFNLVAAMVDDLASRQYKNTGDSWLDHTTVVVFSEFSRSSLINGSGGRDHALVNACMLLGACIKPGQVIGRSSDLGLGPVPVNLTTGLPDPDSGNGVILKPEHIHAALFQSMGITEDILDLRVDPLSALLV